MDGGRGGEWTDGRRGGEGRGGKGGKGGEGGKGGKGGKGGGVTKSKEDKMREGEKEMSMGDVAYISFLAVALFMLIGVSNLVENAPDELNSLMFLGVFVFFAMVLAAVVYLFGGCTPRPPAAVEAKCENATPLLP